MSWELVQGTEEHLPQINLLSQEVWGFPMHEAHLQWRYFHNPAGNAVITFARELSSGNMIGFYVAVPVVMQLGKDQVLGAQVVDTMVHPNYQGKGLFGKMADACFMQLAQQGCDVIYGFPNDNAYSGCINRLNWHHTGPIPLWLRPLRKGFGRFLPRGKMNPNISHELPSIDALDAFLLRSELPSKQCRIKRSGAWYHWRYDARGIRHTRDDSPRAYFWHCDYDDAGALRAFCVWGILDAGDATLCEWQGVSASASNAVLRDAIALAYSKNLNFFRAYWQTPEDPNRFWKFGFLRLPARLSPRLIVRLLTARNPGGNVHQHQSWRIIGGDFDTQ